MAPVWRALTLALVLAGVFAVAPVRVGGQEVVADGVTIDPVNGAQLGGWEALANGTVRMWEISNRVSVALPCGAPSPPVRDYGWIQYSYYAGDPLDTTWWLPQYSGRMRLGGDPAVVAEASGWNLTLRMHVGPPGTGDWMDLGPTVTPTPIALINAAGVGVGMEIPADAAFGACDDAGPVPPPVTVTGTTLRGNSAPNTIGCIACDGKQRFIGFDTATVALGLGPANPAAYTVGRKMEAAGTLRNLQVTVSKLEGGNWGFMLWVNDSAETAGVRCNIGPKHGNVATCSSPAGAEFAVKAGDVVSLSVGNPGDTITRGDFTVAFSVEFVPAP